MAILPIIHAPDPQLKIKCRRVDAVDDALRRLLDDMLETMYEAPGIGLSAPQVGDARRLVVCDVAREDDEPQPVKLINPEIVWASPERLIHDEGCLSLPEHYAEVERPARVRVGYRDETGAEREIEASGLLAACLQHEIDHLDGILFVDYLSPLRRNIILRKMKKQKRQLQAA